MINDYFAVTHLDLASDDGCAELRSKFCSYHALGVRKLHLALDYDPSITVSSYFVKNKLFFDHLKKIPSGRLSVKYIFTVPLIKDISHVTDLERFAVTHNDKKFIYIKLTPFITADEAIYELHNIIFKRNLKPILISYQICRFYLADKLIDSLSSIPGAIYQIDLASLADKSTRKFVRSLIIQNKTVIFGSAEKFDALLHINMPYYTKLLRSAIGEKTFAYYILQHNRLF